MDSSDMCWPSAHMQADDTKHLATKVRNPSPIYQLAWMIQKSLEGHSESKQKQVTSIRFGSFSEERNTIFRYFCLLPQFHQLIPPWSHGSDLVFHPGRYGRGWWCATGTAARWSETTPWGLPTEWQAMPEITQGGTVNFLSLKNATRGYQKKGRP